MAVEESVFRGVITFLDQIGIYDVVLPFLLVFTIVFAILEKTAIFGHETINGKSYTKKNLNSMVAFVSAFLVVASSRLVATINEALANVVLLLLLSISFLMLIGSFYKEGESVSLEGGWRNFFMIAMFVGIVFVFLHAIKTKDGDSFLVWLWEYLSDYWTTNFVATIILILGIVVFMFWITKPEAGTSSPKKE